MDIILYRGYRIFLDLMAWDQTLWRAILIPLDTAPDRSLIILVQIPCRDKIIIGLSLVLWCLLKHFHILAAVYSISDLIYSQLPV